MNKIACVKITYCILIIAASIVWSGRTGGNVKTTSESRPAENVIPINLPDFLELYKVDGVVVLDVRSNVDHLRDSIPGSKLFIRENAPWDDMQLLKEKVSVIVYGSSADPLSVVAAAHYISQKSERTILYLESGIEGWNSILGKLHSH